MVAIAPEAKQLLVHDKIKVIWSRYAGARFVGKGKVTDLRLPPPPGMRVRARGVLVTTLNSFKKRGVEIVVHRKHVPDQAVKTSTGVPTSN